MLLNSWKQWLSCGAVAAASLSGLIAQAEPPEGKRGIIVISDAEETKEGAGEKKVLQLRKQVREGNAAREVKEGQTGQIRLDNARIVNEGEELELDLTTDGRLDLITDRQPVSEFWLGLRLGELPEIAKKQLDLDQGVVVEEVIPDSPAVKAGFKPFDILTKAGDKPLGGPEALMKAVAEAKDKEIVFTVVRGGKVTKIKATPVRRPEGGLQFQIELDDVQKPAAPERAEAIKQLEATLAKLRAEEGKVGSAAIRMLFARPAVIGGDVLKLAHFPKNLRVLVTKDGDGPAKIHVERDGKTWDVTQDKLGDLPEDIRVHVQQMLGHAMPMRMSVTAPATAAFAPGAPPPPGTWTVPVPPPGAEAAVKNATTWLRAQQFQPAPGIEAKIDAILKKLDEMRSEAIERLQDEVKGLGKEVDELREKK